MGALFLMDNLGVPVFRHMGKFWPVLLIVIGLLLLQRRMGGAQPPSEPKPPAPPTPPQGPSNMPGPTGM
jgi:hypothetical protein